MANTQQTLTDNQVWALSAEGAALYAAIIEKGVDRDIAFELTLSLLGDDLALALDGTTYG